MGIVAHTPHILLQKSGESLVKVSVTANVSAPTAAGQVMLRLINPGVGSSNDIFMGKYNAGLPAGVQQFNWEFRCRLRCKHHHLSITLTTVTSSADSGMFDCAPEPCPGTYGMDIAVCELECTDNKQPGHAILDEDKSHTFQIFQ